MKKIRLILACLFCLTIQYASAKPGQVDYTILSAGGESFPTTVYGNPYSGNYRSILEIAPEVTGLKGVRLPVDKQGNLKATRLQLKFNQSVKLLLGVAGPSGQTFDASMLAKLDFHKGKVSSKPVLLNALSITELPAMDVYEVRYPAGEQELTIPENPGFHIAVLGAVSSGKKIAYRDVKLPDQEDYEAFYIDGFVNDTPLFTVVGGQDQPVINVGSPGTEEILGGFEAGSVVRVNGVYHMFPTERTGAPDMPMSHDRVKTRIGHWTSPDAICWTRQTPIIESTGVYAIVHEDNPMNDRRSAIWSFNAVFSEENNRWYGYYLAYTTDKDVQPNHSFGRIWRCESQVPGIEGIGGPYKDMGIIVEPGLDSQLWEGRQGVASFYPFKVKDHWYGFISGAYPFLTKEDYPLHGGKKKMAWYVGLAQSETMEGPWTRMGEDVNPLTCIHPTFCENPIVSQLPNGLYIAMFDGGPSYLKLPNKIAYTLSKDGVNWTRAHYLAIDSTVNKWWMTMRTPLCLIPEGDDVYTIVYTAWVHDDTSDNPNAKTRFNPVGMVKVKIDNKVLDEIAKGL
ncbi:hypothetical protein [Bacteroides sp. 51]|uniref:hypothetical protein n=1 Tax=Bacteroides sp. 51 TaxID=2302938 RepID=UPI0013D8CB0B|nr:hypothetical protein [Bacteroides sp. 51]NDV84508.1 hypothetical protein [Bacteroides sp. 51]